MPEEVFQVARALTSWHSPQGWLLVAPQKKEEPSQPSRRTAITLHPSRKMYAPPQLCQGTTSTDMQCSIFFKSSSIFKDTREARVLKLPVILKV